MPSFSSWKTYSAVISFAIEAGGIALVGGLLEEHRAAVEIHEQRVRRERLEGLRDGGRGRAEKSGP